MAAAVDPEEQTVPLAFSLAEGQTNNTWSWFMQLLRKRASDWSAVFFSGEAVFFSRNIPA